MVNETDFIPPPEPEGIVPIPNKIDMEHCPLCLEKWKLVEEEGKEGKVYFACFNSYCEVSIWVRDKLLGVYFKTEKPPCAICGKEMRIFYRSDGYLKCYCPGCKAVVEHVDEKKHEAMVQREVAQGKRWINPKKFKGMK